MQSIRSFVAVPLPRPVQKNVAGLIERLREPGDGVKWVPTDNLHLTLKFLGEVDNTEIPEVCNVLRNVIDSYHPFELNFVGTGGFPNLSRPRVVYVGVEDPSGSLRSMVAELERALADLGFKPEPRDYQPHLTLGRARGSSRRIGEELIQRLASQGQNVFGDMTVESVQLMASFLDKAGPTYQVMDTIQL